MAVPCPDHRGRAKPPPAPLLSRPSCARSTSPLAPTPHSTTPRPTFPRSKPDQNLYRAAIAGCMRATPHGKKILNMGARLAISILTATQELERIVAAQRDVPSDGDKPLSSSWVVLPDDDWEMVDASAPSREVIRAVAVV
ncbi:hypothetical protein FA95DRAFT_1494211 [Auriscalpium vulgare]|uniref:Uncharacterized protein n=1 Tax=Auriscalpium vulgare TaxID=40419 RepID=A0ACB8RQP6_9AGAM|nr:hypothetical protein FA95DRAFT_1494211 [Auriscalpium vulgare]